MGAFVALQACGSEDATRSTDAVDAGNADGSNAAGGAGAGASVTGGSGGNTAGAPPGGSGGAAGSATAGASSAGTSSGGMPSGGTSSAGSSSGGTASGGTASGGTASGGTAGSGGSSVTPLPPCGPDPGAVFGVPGFELSVVAQGAPLKKPISIELGADGLWYVSDNKEPPPSQLGEILRVNADGTLSTYLAEPGMIGTHHFRFLPSGQPGVVGEILVGFEDLDDGLPDVFDQIWRGSPGNISSIIDCREPGDLLFGRGAFGAPLYYSSGQDVERGVRRLWQSDLAGGRSELPVVTAGGATVSGIFPLAWGAGGAFGMDMYVGTFASAGDPLAIDAVYRVDAGLTATPLTTDVSGVLRGLAPNPSPGDAFGEYIYAASPTGIARIDPAGVVTEFVTLVETNDLEFHDGSLFIAESGAGRMVRISACM